MGLEETLAEGAVLARAETDNGEQENPALGTDAYKMGFSGRLTNVFRRLGIETLGDITNYDLTYFASLRNVGPTSLAGLTRKLSEMGLALRDETGLVADYSRYYGRVWEAINAGAQTRTKISEETGLSYSLVCRIISSNSQFNERVKRVQRRRDRSMLAELAAKGLTQAEIGRELGVTGERARQLLNGEGLNELRKNRKPVSKFSVRGKTIANVLRGVLKGAYARASEVERRAYDILENDSRNLHSFGELVEKIERGELLAEQRAVAYMAKHPNTRYPFGRLVSFYRTYGGLRESGEKISLAELSQRAGLGHNYGEAARNLLGSLGLQNLTGRERKQLEEWKRGALKRAVQSDSKFSSYDVARFLGMDACHVSLYFQWFGQGRKRRGARCEGFPIGYATMSTIYEAFDARCFDVDEMAELAGVSRGAVIYALTNRKEHSQEIRRGLRILFPGRETDKPYLVKGR